MLLLSLLFVSLFFISFCEKRSILAQTRLSSGTPNVGLVSFLFIVFFFAMHAHLFAVKRPFHARKHQHTADRCVELKDMVDVFSDLMCFSVFGCTRILIKGILD